MAQTKNLCAQIPTALHERVCEAKEQSGLRDFLMQFQADLRAEIFCGWHRFSPFA